MAVKKAAANKSNPSKTSVVETGPQTISKPKIPVSNKTLVIALIVALILIGAYLLRNQIIVATVNGQPISRVSLLQELEKQQGKKVLDTMITTTLIFQEAEKKNEKVSDEEVNNEIKKISENLKKQGQDLNTALTAQGMTLEGLKEQIKIQLTLKKLLAKQLVVSNKEINDYLEKNKESLPKIDANQLKDSVKSQLEQEKFNTAVNELIQSLKAKAKISSDLFK
ncbi:SurA N-terminal domain-containing protein [Patescibacteria group bacterium]|nr:SurA N-terminal domain-containing protein [Patescibacteria group bacterium]